MIRKLFALVLKTFLSLILGSIVLVVAYKWIPPPGTLLMLQRKIEAISSGAESSEIHYEWVSLDEISPYLVTAVVSSEDRKFLIHEGFDWDAIERAMDYNEGVGAKKGRMRGASTISQQVAKNVFLWNHRSWLRKGLEAYFTFLIEKIWGKRRIMEMYVNVIEMGDRVFGAQAASTYYFKKSPDKLTQLDAALIAAVLPNPRRYRVDAPSSYVLKRQASIAKTASGIGGKAYVAKLK